MQKGLRIVWLGILGWLWFPLNGWAQDVPASQPRETYIDQLNDHAWTILRIIPDSTEFYARKAIQFSSGNPPYLKGLINGHTILGVLYKDKEFLSLSVENYLEALKWAEEAKDSLRISSCLNNIGVVYQLQENYERAMDYFEKSLAIEERLGKDPGQKSIRLYNIGEMNEKLQKPDQAFAHYYQSLLIEEKLPNPEGIFYARLGLGRMHLQRGNLGDGARELGIAAKWLDSIQDPNAVLSYHLASGELHHQAGDAPSALKSFQTARNWARKNSSQRMEMDALEGMVKQYRALGEYDQAMAYQDSFLILMVNQNSAAVSTSIAELQYRYELKKKEAEIAKLKEQDQLRQTALNRQHTIKIYLLIVLISLIALAGVRFSPRLSDSLNKRQFFPQKNWARVLLSAAIGGAYWVAGYHFFNTWQLQAPIQLGGLAFMLLGAMHYLFSQKIQQFPWPNGPLGVIRTAGFWGIWVVIMALIPGLISLIAGKSPTSPFSLFTDTALLSILPTASIFYHWERRKKAKTPAFNEKNAQNEPADLLGDKQANTQMLFKAELGTQTITLSPTDIMAVEAANNYCKFHIYQGGNRKTEMLRISIKNVAQQLSDFPFMIRCHRSFLVNGHFAQSIDGTARSERLKLRDLEIPLSRSFDKNLLQPYLAHPKTD